MKQAAMRPLTALLVLAVSWTASVAGQQAPVVGREQPTTAAATAPAPLDRQEQQGQQRGQPLEDDSITARERYRLQPGDVFELRYRYSPEFNETATLQPDGFVTLEIAGELKAAGLTVAELTTTIRDRSSKRLRDPYVAITLKDFERPHFVVAGEVEKTGRYDLRGHTTVIEAIALAGGFTHDARHSQVLLVRRLDDDRARVHPMDLKKLMRHPAQGEEYTIRSGDVLIVPQNTISKVDRIIKWTGAVGAIGLLIP
jgi:polysaccharide export outer membrane protein